jgi:hypothetical protein
MHMLYPLAVSVVVTAVILAPSAIALWWEGRQQREIAATRAEGL